MSAPPQFDDSRIKDHPNQKLLAAMKKYFATFTSSNYDDMRAAQAEGYTMTDIRKSVHTFAVSCLEITLTRRSSLALCVVKVNRDTWYQINKGFVQGVTDTSVTALSLDGSCEPGFPGVMENLVSFKLKSDPPPGAADNLPPGAKAGDTVQMIMLSVIWWNEDGKIQKEIEYGRLTWPGFTLDAYDKAQ